MSVIQAGNTTTTSLIYTGDTTGNLVFTTGGANTTALTLSNTQAATFANNVTISGALTTTGAVTQTGNAAFSANVSVAGSLNSINTFGFKNRIINGGMTISQYNGTSSVNAVNTTYILDRWVGNMTVAGKFTAQQSSTAPTGFINSLLLTSTSAYTLTTGEFVATRQLIEGLNVSDLAWGTASAKAVTLSFWVRSSLTGTFGGSIANSAGNRIYVYSYTINSANTWEQKTITIAGDTTGTWLTTNGTGIGVRFCIGAASDYQGTSGSWGTTVYAGPTGQTSLVATNGATFYITGIQLESGSQATSFDFRSYGTEFGLCQRYFEKSYLDGTAVGAFSANDTNSVRLDPITQGQSVFASINFNTRKRTSPTMTAYDAAFNAGKVSYFNGSWVNNGGTGAWNAYQSGATLPISAQTNSIAYSFAWIASAEL